MNKVILMGRLTRDPEVRYSQGENSLAIANYTLAVDRRFKRDGEASADFINCVAFGKLAEHTERYYRQGLKIALTGRIQTRNYTNRDGVKVYVTEVVVEESEFAESKAASDANARSYGFVASTSASGPASSVDVGAGFMNMPEGSDREITSSSSGALADRGDGFVDIEASIDEELPFN